MNRDDIIRMAREAGFEVYDGDRFMPTHISDTLTHLHNPAVNLATLAYEAGRKDERERILDMCKEGLWDGEGIKFHLDKQRSDQ